MSVFLETYRGVRGKTHGAGPGSRRMALTLAFTAWCISTRRRPILLYWLYFKAPVWMKCSARDRRLG